MRFDAINPGPPLSAAELDEYCAAHDLALPDPLRRQLLDQNGGAPTAEVLVALPDGDETELLGLFGIGMHDVSAELAWNAQTMSGRVPEGLIPFADDAGGNLFLVGADGAVSFWNHELEGSPSAHLPLDQSLDRFLQALS
jgi:SMI1 / KNR4 family (SUKH-1)